METFHSLEFYLTYLKRLVGAGLDGIAAARNEFEGWCRSLSALKPAVWTPAAIGTTIGMLTTRLDGNRKSASRTALGGLVGAALGLGAGLAWAS